MTDLARPIRYPVDQATATALCASLTPRELQVLTGLAAGHTSQQIANDLGCRPRTINTHIAHIYRKLGVGGRVQAARVAWQAGEAL